MFDNVQQLFTNQPNQSIKTVQIRTHLKKLKHDDEISEEKPILGEMHYFIEAAYSRMAEWGCLLNYDFSAFSKKMTGMEASLNNFTTISNFI